jgi:hypothetical protein
LKYKILSVVIAATLLNGCGSSSSSNETTTVQATDGYLYNAVMQADCGGTIYAEYTDKQGNASFDSSKVTAEDCRFTAKNDGNITRDMDNTGEAWVGQLSTPAGKIHINPFSSLIDDYMVANSITDVDAATATVIEEISPPGITLTAEDIFSDFAAGESDESKKIAILANSIFKARANLESEGVTDLQTLGSGLFASLKEVSKEVDDQVATLTPEQLSTTIVTVTIATGGSVETAETAEKVTDTSELPATPTTPAPTGGTGGTGAGSDGGGTGL